MPAPVLPNAKYRPLLKHKFELAQNMHTVEARIWVEPSDALSIRGLNPYHVDAESVLNREVPILLQRFPLYLHSQAGSWASKRCGNTLATRKPS